MQFLFSNFYPSINNASTVNAIVINVQVLSDINPNSNYNSAEIFNITIGGIYLVSIAEEYFITNLKGPDYHVDYQLLPSPSPSPIVYQISSESQIIGSSPSPLPSKLNITNELQIRNASQAGEVGIDGVGYAVIGPNTVTSGTTSSFISFGISDTQAINNASMKGAVFGSSVVNITLIPSSSQLSSSMKICLRVDETKLSSSSTSEYSVNHACLGYLDTSSNNWKCVDQCIHSDSSNSNYYCGSTPHLTNFAILLGGPADASYNKCDYILGSWQNDLILTASVAGFVLLIAILVLLFGCFTPLRRVVYGSKTYEINLLRGKSVDKIRESKNDN